MGEGRHVIQEAALQFGSYTIACYSETFEISLSPGHKHLLVY